MLALALGIGANSAIFSVINALLLKPFSFKSLDRLVMVRVSLPNQGLKATAISAGDFNDFRDLSDVFDLMAAYRIRDVTLTGTNEPELARGSFVSSDFFSALQIDAWKGRTLLPIEDQPGRDQVVVIGYGLWQRRYGTDSNILGSTIIVNDRAVTVVGVAPPNFDYPFGTDLWIPLALTPEEKNQRDARNLYVIAKLKGGVTVSEAQAEMLAIAKRLERQYPQTNTGQNVQVVPLRMQQAEFTGPMLSILIGMSTFLLLLACANVANLLFVRASARKKEIAIRAALSASRWRVIRQLLTEGILLSGIAGILGLILSIWSVDLIKGSLPPDIAQFMAGWKEIGIDGRVVAFTFGIALITTIIFSLVPALHATRLDLSEALKESGKSSDANPRGPRVRQVLVISEIALALVLLVGAGLMVKGFWRILNVYQGHNLASILTFRTPLPEAKYPEKRDIAEFYRRVLERMESTPEINLVSVASNTPLNNSPNPIVELLIEGRPPLLPGERQPSDLMVISPDYLPMIGAKLITGRNFNGGDNQESLPVAMISEMAAHRYWPREDPLGKRIRRDGSDANTPWLTIVGIVSDVKQSWFDNEIRPQVYLPYLQAPRARMSFLLRTSADPMSLVPAARSHILAVDENQPMQEVKTLAQLFVDEASPFRFAAVLMMVFGAIALVLSAIGVYGVMSYSITQRTREIGIRNALGAQRSDLLGLILGQGLRTTLIGSAIGLVLALVLGRVMTGLLFGIVTLDVAVLLGFLLLLIAVSMLSCFIPANQAAKVDPMVALRYE